jgi:hypothetical protein
VSTLGAERRILYRQSHLPLCHLARISYGAYASRKTQQSQNLFRRPRESGDPEHAPRSSRLKLWMPACAGKAMVGVEEARDACMPQRFCGYDESKLFNLNGYGSGDGQTDAIARVTSTKDGCGRSAA